MPDVRSAAVAAVRRAAEREPLSRCPAVVAVAWAGAGRWRRGLQVAEQLVDREDRSRALRAVAVSAARSGETGHARAVLEGVDPGAARLEALQDLLGLPLAGPTADLPVAELAEAALDEVRQVDDPFQRAVVAAGVATAAAGHPVLAGRVASLLDEVERRLPAGGSPWHRTRALRALAVAEATAGRLDRAADLVARMPDPVPRLHAAVDVAALAPTAGQAEPLLADLLEVTAGLDPAARAGLLLRVAALPALEGAVADRWVGEALEVAEQVHDPRRHGLLLAEAARVRPGQRAGELLRAGEQLAGFLDGPHRTEVLLSLARAAVDTGAGHVASRLLVTALEGVEHEDDSVRRAPSALAVADAAAAAGVPDVVLGCLPHLAAARDRTRLLGLAGACLLAGGDAARGEDLLSRAAREAESVGEPGAGASALAALAVAVPERAPLWLARAEDLLRAVQDDAWRLDALHAVVVHCARTGRWPAVERALARLDGDRLGAAVADVVLACEVDEALDRHLALLARAPACAGTAVGERAVAEVATALVRAGRYQEVPGLVRGLSAGARSGALSAATAAAAAAGDLRWAVEAALGEDAGAPRDALLVDLVEQLARSGRPEAADDLIGRISGVAARDRVRSATALAWTDAGQAARAGAAAEGISAAGERARTLAGMSARARDPGTGAALLHQSLGALAEVPADVEWLLEAAERCLTADDGSSADAVLDGLAAADPTGRHRLVEGTALRLASAGHLDLAQAAGRRLPGDGLERVRAAAAEAALARGDHRLATDLAQRLAGPGRHELLRRVCTRAAAADSLGDVREAARLLDASAGSLEVADLARVLVRDGWLAAAADVARQVGGVEQRDRVLAEVAVETHRAGGSPLPLVADTSTSAGRAAVLVRCATTAAARDDLADVLALVAAAGSGRASLDVAEAAARAAAGAGHVATAAAVLRSGFASAVLPGDVERRDSALVAVVAAAVEGGHPVAETTGLMAMIGEGPEDAPQPVAAVLALPAATAPSPATAPPPAIGEAAVVLHAPAAGSAVAQTPLLQAAVLAAAAGQLRFATAAAGAAPTATSRAAAFAEVARVLATSGRFADARDTALRIPLLAPQAEALHALADAAVAAGQLDEALAAARLLPTRAQRSRVLAGLADQALDAGHHELAATCTALTDDVREQLRLLGRLLGTPADDVVRPVARLVLDRLEAARPAGGYVDLLVRAADPDRDDAACLVVALLGVRLTPDLCVAALVLDPEAADDLVEELVAVPTNRRSDPSGPRP